MIKQLLIHLGDRKTGSTSIQTALYKQYWDCDSAELIYPVTSSTWNHNGLATSIGQNNTQRIKDFGEKFRKTLLHSDADYAVLSGEHFERVDPKFLLEFIKSFIPEAEDKLRLIVYIRPHASRFVSSYAERVKLGTFQGSMSELHEKFKLSKFLMYHNRLQDWKSTFANKLTIKPFIRTSLYQQNVVNDFFKYVFQSNPYNLKTMKMSNESLCLEDLAILNEIHRIIKAEYGNQIKPNILKGFSRKMAVQLSESKFEGTKVQLHKDLAENIRLFYMEDAKIIDKEYFEESIFEKSLVDYTSNFVESEQSLEIGKYLSKDNIRYIKCWTAFLGPIMSKKPKIFMEATKHLKFRVK